jgi:hypothetical protein
LDQLRSALRSLSRLLFAASLAGVGCSAAPSPLANTFESKEAVASAVLRAFQTGDVAALRSLALNENEFRNLVWPELPASRKERNLPFDYVWNDLAGKSEAHLRQRANDLRDHGYSFVSIAFKGNTDEYDNFRVFRDSELVLRGQQGEERKRIFGSVIEQNGRFKVFSYVVD